MEKYKDSSLPTEDRLEDLMQRMTFEDKINQITCLVTITPDVPDFKEYVPEGIGNVGAFTVSENAEKIAEYSMQLQRFLVNETPLGIPALIHCEASAGAQFTEADVFPSAIAQASTFDTEVVKSMADIIRRQLVYVGFRQALSPVADISRDPRWGRITETYGEDPTLAAAMTDAFVRGLQTEHLKDGVVATAKHFVAHGVTEGGLNMSRSLATERELLEVHCKPFQCAISQSHMKSVMNSYCSWNGEPVVGSKKILTDILRDQMGFEGFVVSDYVSVDRMVDPFCVASDFEQAGIRAIKAGLDVEYPRPKGFTFQMKNAVEAGELSMDFIDRAVRRVLTTKFELGLFENPYPDYRLLEQQLHRDDTRKLNERMALESITLLKNENKVLPLSKEVKRVAVIGPHADCLRSYFGTFSYPAVLDMTMSREEDGQIFEEPGLIIYDIEQKYTGQIREVSPRVEKQLHSQFPYAKSLCEALEEYLPHAEILYAKGINCAGTDTGGLEEALHIAAQADVVIMTLGGKNGWGATSTVGEGVDATDIGLPGQQEEFAKKVFGLHKKTVVLHFDGRPLSSPYVASCFDAILEVWQPGEQAGQALCKILFGDYSPAGRLPVTVARNVGQLPVYFGLPRGSGYIAAGHTGMIRNKNGYINDTAFPLFYFGHGLSYTEFTYTNLIIDKKEVQAEDVIRIQVDVANSGDFDADEVVQLYVTDEMATMVRPQLELAGFRRVHLQKKETKTIAFFMKVSQVAFLDEDMKWVVEQGVLSVKIGASSIDIRLKDRVYIKETRYVDPKTRGFYAQTEVIEKMRQ